jgi:hypothetical protein
VLRVTEHDKTPRRHAPEYVIARDSVAFVTDATGTPIGRLIRTSRTAARLNRKEASHKTPGVSYETWGVIERGHDRAGNVPRAEAATLADMCASLGITPEQVEAADPEDGAPVAEFMREAIRRGTLRLVPAVPDELGDDAGDALIELFMAERADRDVLEFMWRDDTDSDGRPIPRAERLRRMSDWVRKTQQRQEPPAGRSRRG